MSTTNIEFEADEFLSEQPKNLNLSAEEAFTLGLVNQSYVDYRKGCDAAAAKDNNE